mmetsp:Transcript_19715/g.55413  ORF Transcript_19715/g.55413 Transcript_19715/m.55413 type:complete len:301 (+) Transcript_19715:662-1564(+)
MRGSIPKARAVLAVSMAVSAIWSVVGLARRPPSLMSLTPSPRSMKKSELTVATPGAPLITCSTGRITSELAWHAPVTTPSTWPVWSIMTPNQVVSPRIRSVACWGVSFRASQSAPTRPSMLAVAGSMILAAPSETPAAFACSAIFPGGPRMVSVQSPRARTSPAAAIVRTSSPSGNRMCCGLARAPTDMLCRSCLGSITSRSVLPGASVTAFAMEASTRPQTSRDCAAMERSSSVGTTMTFVCEYTDWTSPASRVAFFSTSMSMPSVPRPSQTILRSPRSPSPTPAVKTSASSLPLSLTR